MIPLLNIKNWGRNIFYVKIDQAQFYRARAEAERLQAKHATLPRERERHLKAAEVWDGMAEKIEHTARLKVRNDAVKRRIEGSTLSHPRSRVSRKHH